MASNIILFPVIRANSREEIRHLREWRAQIETSFPAMNWLGQEMAGVILGSIDRDLAALEGRAA